MGLVKNPEEGASWYVVHTNTGCEAKVKANLEHRISVMKMHNFVFDILVPVEAEQEEYRGKKDEKKKKKLGKRIFPGYILVKMNLNDTSWGCVRKTPGVTGFVGLGRRPTPLHEKEVENILYQMGLQHTKPVAHHALSEGQRVKVTEGPFADFIGVVDSVNLEKKVLTVLVHIFGRETSVELSFLEVEEI